jgi:hypothetical protein
MQLPRGACGITSLANIDGERLRGQAIFEGETKRRLDSRTVAH